MHSITWVAALLVGFLTTRHHHHHHHYDDDTSCWRRPTWGVQALAVSSVIPTTTTLRKASTHGRFHQCSHPTNATGRQHPSRRRNGLKAALGQRHRSIIPNQHQHHRLPHYPPLPPSSSSSSTTTTRRMMLSSLHQDPSYCLTAVLLVSTFGIALEQRTMIGKALSAPLATMAVALILANIGVLPFCSPIYTVMNQYAVSLAVPMLLYDSNLRRVVSDTGSVLFAFLIGAMATVIGTLIAFPILPMKSLGWQQGYKVACALCARHIGGAINFVAVAETLQIPGTIVSAAIAADNVVVALYFAVLFALAKADPFPTKDTTTNEPSTTIKRSMIESELDYSLDTIPSGNNTSTTSVVVVEPDRNEISLPTISLSLAVASSLVTIGKIATKSFLPPGTSALPLTSSITVLAATLFPKFFAKIRTAGTAIGILFIQLFFAASGASGSIALVFQQAPSLFVFSILQIMIHFIVLVTVGRGLFKLPLNELYLASNANVGGPTTAAAMAQAKNWTRLVLPALLVGILGYATATGIALALGPILVRLPLLPVHR